MIHLRDLAKIFLAVYENPSASGRYFGVYKSLHWEDIYNECKKLIPNMKMPQGFSEAPVKPTTFDLQALNLNKDEFIYESKGCSKCNGTGYLGRQALFELVSVDATLQRLIHEQAGEIELENAIREDVPSIREAGFAVVREGITTTAEVLRVTSV